MLHTRYNHLAQVLAICLQADSHLGGWSQGLALHTDVANYKFLTSRYLQREVTVNIGDGTCTCRSSDYDRCTDDRFTIFLRNYGTCYFRLSQCPPT